VDQESTKLAKALRHFDLCPETEGDDTVFRFLGLWSKNCAKWCISLLAAMKQKTTVVGFYDAMGNEAVDFIAV